MGLIAYPDALVLDSVTMPPPAAAPLVQVEIRSLPIEALPAAPPPFSFHLTDRGDILQVFYADVPDRVFAPTLPQFRATAAGLAVCDVPDDLLIVKQVFLCYFHERSQRSDQPYTSSREKVYASCVATATFALGTAAADVDREIARDFDRLFASCLREGLLEEVPLPS